MCNIVYICSAHTLFPCACVSLHNIMYCTYPFWTYTCHKCLAWINAPIQMKLQATEHEQERLSLQQQLQAQSTAKQQSVMLQHVHVHVCMYMYVFMYWYIMYIHCITQACVYVLYAIMCMCLHTCTCFVWISQTIIRHKKQFRGVCFLLHMYMYIEYTSMDVFC